MNLIEFVNARLDEDEATAKAALWADDSAEWTAFHRASTSAYGRWVIVDSYEEGVTEIRAHAADDEGVARHIARFDPARVLREVKGKREIVWRCTIWMNEPGPGADQESYLMDLAAAWSDHPDYDESWRPE